MGIKTRQELVDWISEGLRWNSEYGNTWFLDLTDQTAGINLGDGDEWPRDGDKVLAISPLSSHEAFGAMEQFAELQSDDASTALVRALSGHRPFAHFKMALEPLDLEEDWHAFRDKWFAERAEEWMRNHGVDFVNGRVVSSGLTETWEAAQDEDGDEEAANVDAP